MIVYGVLQCGTDDHPSAGIPYLTLDIFEAIDKWKHGVLEELGYWDEEVQYDTVHGAEAIEMADEFMKAWLAADDAGMLILRKSGLEFITNVDQELEVMTLHKLFITELKER